MPFRAASAVARSSQFAASQRSVSRSRSSASPTRSSANTQEQGPLISRVSDAEREVYEDRWRKIDEHDWYKEQVRQIPALYIIERDLRLFRESNAERLRFLDDCSTPSRLFDEKLIQALEDIEVYKSEVQNYVARMKDFAFQYPRYGWLVSEERNLDANLAPVDEKLQRYRDRTRKWFVGCPELDGPERVTDLREVLDAVEARKYSELSRVDPRAAQQGFNRRVDILPPDFRQWAINRLYVQVYVRLMLQLSARSSPKNTCTTGDQFWKLMGDLPDDMAEWAQHQKKMTEKLQLYKETKERQEARSRSRSPPRRR